MPRTFLLAIAGTKCQLAQLLVYATDIATDSACRTRIPPTVAMLRHLLAGIYCTCTGVLQQDGAAFFSIPVRPWLVWSLQVWETHPQRVTAIEPSNAMVKLANKLWHAQRAQHTQHMQRLTPHAEQQTEHMQQPGHSQPAGIYNCSIQWHRQLHPSMLPSNKSRSQQTRRQMHDLVVASYVLTEMQSDAERQQAVDMLWRQTKDVLVLVEPGTPSGSAYVRQARSQVLG